MRFHYTFYSYEEYGRGYIGSRSCRCLPVNDIRYFGSYTEKSFSPTKKIILEVHNSAEESLAAEAVLHDFYNVAENPHFVNKQNACGGKGVSYYGETNPHYGKKHSKEAKAKIRQRKLDYEATRVTPEMRESRRRANTERFGGVPKSDEHKRKIGEANGKCVVFISPEGERVKVKNISRFCKENNLSRSFLYNAHKICTKTGWRLELNKNKATST